MARLHSSRQWWYLFYCTVAYVCMAVMQGELVGVFARLKEALFMVVNVEVIVLKSYVSYRYCKCGNVQTKVEAM